MRLIVLFLAAFGLLVVVVTATPLVSWWAGLLAGPWNDPTGDVLIVLVGSTMEEGMVGESSYWRSVYALLAWREGTLRQIVISGSGSHPMQMFLEAHGVPREVIRLEARSTSTRENAMYAAELLAGLPGRKILLTSDYHMFRAHRAFQKAGCELEPRPFPDARKRAAAWHGRWPVFLDLAVETVKIAHYFAKGWI